MLAPSGRLSRVFCAGCIVYDEARRELLVHGQRRALEAKPMALLHALLVHQGAVVSKQALIEAVWGNADHTSGASLANAVSKVRAALGEAGRDLIEAVHGSGYRITAQVEVAASAHRPMLTCPLQAGELVPERPHWRLHAQMGGGQGGEAGQGRVWLARHIDGEAECVITFTDAKEGLSALQRQADASRLLQRALGERPDLVAVNDTQFMRAPFFIARPYGGIDLPCWAEKHGGLDAVPIEMRLLLIARLARSLAAAHSAGVLHGDLRPANILLDDLPDAPAMPRLLGFLGGRQAEDDAARAMQASPIPTSRAMAPYEAPELATGGGPTIAADIYALGVLLYQLVTADFSRQLTIGWEAGIRDSLLRHDIEVAASGDPQRRLASAERLAERLESLPARRQARRRRIDERVQAARLRRQVERSRLRRPWITAAAASMMLGCCLAIAFGISALHERDQARSRALLAQSVSRFLTEDLLGRGNPALSGRPDETLMQAAAAAEAAIDRRLGNEPMQAGAIYAALARTYDSRSTYDAARRAYGRAAAYFDRAQAGAAAAAITRFQQAAMEAKSGQPDSLPRAKQLVLAASRAMPALVAQRREAEVWQLAATGLIAMVQGDMRAGQAALQSAADEADTLPDVFDEPTRLTLRRQLATTYMRQGDWGPAETLLTSVMQRELALNGPRYPDTLHTALELAETKLARGHVALAVADFDRLYPIVASVFGPSHRITLELLADRADALAQLGRYDEAQAAEMSLYDLAVAREGSHSWAALGTLASAALSQCRAGKVELGLASARIAHDKAQQSFGDRHVLTQNSAGDQAFCLIMAGQYAEASRLLSGIDAAAVAQGTIDPTYGSQIDLMRAAIALATGDKDAAGLLLRKVQPIFGPEDADIYMHGWLQRLNTLLQSQLHASPPATTLGDNRSG